MRQCEGHGLDVEVVAEQHRDVVAPSRVHGQSAAPQIGVVDDVVVDERRRMDELHDGGVQDGAVAGVAAQPRRHQEDGRSHAFPAARADVLPDLRNQRDPGLDVTAEFLVDFLEVCPDRFEDLREGERFFHSGAGGLYHGLNKLWKLAVVRRAIAAASEPCRSASTASTRST